MKNVLKLTGFSLRNRKYYILGWCIGAAAMLFIYMILYPSIQELGQAKMDLMPASVMKIVGVDSLNVMSNWVTYFGMIFGLFVVVISFFAASFAGSSIYLEEKTKSIEFMNALPVSRTEIYISKVLSSFIAVLMVSFAADITAILCGLINGGDTFKILDVLQIMIISGFIPFFFMSLALLSGGITAKISPSITGSALVIIFYMFSYLGNLLEDKGTILSDITPFKQFDYSNALAFDNKTAIAFAVFFIIFAAAEIVGGIVYKKRDFKI